MIAVVLQLYYSLCVPRRMLFSSGRHLPCMFWKVVLKSQKRNLERLFEQEINDVEKIQRYYLLCGQRRQLASRDYLLLNEVNVIIRQSINAHACEKLLVIRNTTTWAYRVYNLNFDEAAIANHEAEVTRIRYCMPKVSSKASNYLIKAVEEL